MNNELLNMILSIIQSNGARNEIIKKVIRGNQPCTTFNYLKLNPIISLF